MPDVNSRIDRWASWVEEMHSHPFDQFEWQGALECRDLLAVELEIAGDSKLWTRVDEVDERFRDVTRPTDESDGEHPDAWWRRRLPTGDEALRYLHGEQ